jgi:YebC/PmpR family DNA-binding regulatory protein
MSGHSHFSKIKHKKSITDAKRGQVFSKMARVLAIAAREGGADPETNSKLRLTIEQAKAMNLPKDNIERAIKKGVGETEGARLEEVLFEAYGPGGIAIIIEGITDNKNRALGEIKQILSQHNGKLAGEGSVKWLFERKGVVIIEAENQTPQFKEELELKAIEAGAEDVLWRNGFLEIYTKANDLENIKNNLEKQGQKIESVFLAWIAKEEIEIEEKQKQACEKLFESLDESDTVQEIYSSLKI